MTYSYDRTRPLTVIDILRVSSPPAPKPKEKASGISVTHATWERNRVIARAVLEGASINEVAQQHGITRARAHQIVHRWCQQANPQMYETRPSGNQVRWLRGNKESFLRALHMVQITDLGLTVRTRNVLASVGVRTLADLSRFSRAEVAKFRNLGTVSIKEIEGIASQYGVTFQPDPPPLRRPTARRPLSWDEG